MSLEQTVEIEVNGVGYRRVVPALRLLTAFLRDDLGLTGTHVGCGQGLCGCCTVLLDGRPVKACLVLAVQADGGRVTTIEGLARGDRLDPLQIAFVEAGAVQCGFCIPGMIMSARALLDEVPAPSDAEIREALANNLCRCTGYVKIVEAVRAAARGRGGGALGPGGDG
jgi:carbon-monoxide dehydrogenase small subunit